MTAWLPGCPDHLGLGAYETVKGAVLSLTRSMGAELAPTVRSVAIAPAFVPASARNGFPRQTGRDVADQDFAAVAAFLASDAAAYITAAGLVVDGSRLTV